MSQPRDPASFVFETRTREIGRTLAAHLPRPSNAPSSLIERAMMRRLVDDAEFRAAVFRFVDVRPACRDRAAVSAHLVELFAEAEGSSGAKTINRLLRHRAVRHPAAFVASGAVTAMASRFIAGRSIELALPELQALWDHGDACTVDLLGEATVSDDEAERYAARCEATLRGMTAAMRRWHDAPLLEHDGVGRLSRANLSIKLSALTAEMRPYDPARGAAGAGKRLRRLLRVADELDAHLHVDMESFDLRDTVTHALFEILADPQFATGPSIGVVLQAYLRESGQHLDEVLAWDRAHPRATPLTVRLVKGAYWDHEVIAAAQSGWEPPVFIDKHRSDAQFERLTRRLIDGYPHIRPAIASHNLRSVAHAIAWSESRGLAADAIEFQVLRGLGDATGNAIAALGYRVRAYCPVGDLVEGMAYLVRRLLENTSNDSFLAAHAAGSNLDALLVSPS